METRKSPKADLEAGWGQRFLLGLIVALASLFVAFEFTLSPDDPLDDPELLGQLEGFEELAPFMRPENELALAPKAEPDPTLQLKIVEEDEAEEPEKRQPEMSLEGDPGEDDLPEEDEQTQKEDEEVVSFRVVEDLPQFPGGPLEFIKWLTRNLKYPAEAQEEKIQGKVLVEFIVNKDGSVTDVKVVRPLHPLCDREALRVLRMMPRWTAGIENDQPCRTKVCIPIVFKL